MEEMRERPKAERRKAPRLNRDDIVAAADAVVTTEGTAALTMRRLAATFGVDHAALYRHFRDKQELLLAVADRRLAERAEVPPGADWRETLRVQMRHAVDRYRVHPDLARLIAAQPGGTATMLDLIEQMLATLEGLGLSPEQAATMMQVLEAHVVGAGLYGSVMRTAAAEGRVLDGDAERRALAITPPERYPRAHAAAPHLFMGVDEVFERGLDLILDGIERLAAPEYRQSIHP